MRKLLLVAALLVPTSVAAATEYDDPKYQNSSDCRYYLQFDPEITKCINHIETKKCNTLRPFLIKTKDYPVEGKRNACTWLQHLTPQIHDRNRLVCTRSKLMVGCKGGGCWVATASGEYGFFPGKRNLISLNGEKWSFTNDLSRQQEFSLWQSLVSGKPNRFAYQVVLWPYENQVTGSQTVFVPVGLKEKLYQMSLAKP